MAFTTIEWNGRGVVANCDALADTAGGTWAELGGGGISANTDNYLLPPASIGHVYASKSGFGYYTTPLTYNFDTAGAEEGQFIYIWIQIQSASAFDLLVNNGFSFVVGTDTSNYRTFKLAGSGIGEGKPFDGGGWKLFVIDPTVTGSIADVGTFNLATINMIGLWMDTIVSVRADTIFIDQISIGKGLRVTGTGTIGEIIDYCTDYTNRAWGVFQKRGSIGFAYGSLTVGDNTNATVNTALSDDGTVIEFGYTEFWNGTAWALTHPVDYNQVTVEKHVSFTTDYDASGTSMFGSALAKLKFTNESGITHNHLGGQLKYISTISANSGDTYEGVGFSLYDIRTLGVETYSGCTFDGSATLTVDATADFASNNIINGVSAVTSISTIDLGFLASNKINSSGSNHGVELATVGDGSMVWDCVTAGFDAGVTGSPVTPTATGNEDIFVSATTGTITINVASGATTPSVRSAGAIVNIVAGQVTASFTVAPSTTGFEYAIYEVTAKGSLLGQVEKQHVESALTDSFDYTYTYSAGTIIAVQVLPHSGNDFEETILYIELSSNDQSFTVELDEDNNN